MPKRDIRVAKWTVQKYMRDARPPRRADQIRATSLRNHDYQTRARDFLPVTDRLSRPLYAFFVVAHGSRRIVHIGVTRHPTDARVARQPREATPFGRRPRYLLRDNDREYGGTFMRVAAASGSTEVRTGCVNEIADRLPSLPEYTHSWPRKCQISAHRPVCWG